MGLDVKTYHRAQDHRVKAYPLGRVGQSIDIANAILFLASDECSWVTGMNFVVEHGGANNSSTLQKNCQNSGPLTN